MILSRRDPELIKTLFELEVPEIADGLVEIRGVAREPGYRSKIAVESHAQGVDPVGACVGPRGSRVRMVVSELRGEKIDIIPWNPEPARFVAKALSPARVREVFVDDETKEATVIVPDDQLALAIGKEGLNARLAARLTGWKVDIQSDTEFAQAEAAAAYGGANEGEEFTGRCSAVLSNGKRCPNEALPGLALLRAAGASGACAAGRQRLRAGRGTGCGRSSTGCGRGRRDRSPRFKTKRQRSRWPPSPLSSPNSQRSNRCPSGFRAIRPPATATPRSIRQLRDRADQKLHRLRAESPPGAASALRGGGRSARSGRRHARSRGLYLPAARLLRACGLAPRLQPHVTEDRPDRSGTVLPLHLSI